MHSIMRRRLEAPVPDVLDPFGSHFRCRAPKKLNTKKKTSRFICSYPTVAKRAGVKIYQPRRNYNCISRNYSDTLEGSPPRWEKLHRTHCIRMRADEMVTYPTELATFAPKAHENLKFSGCWSGYDNIWYPNKPWDLECFSSAVWAVIYQRLPLTPLPEVGVAPGHSTCHFMPQQTCNLKCNSLHCGNYHTITIMPKQNEAFRMQQQSKWSREALIMHKRRSNCIL